MSDAFLIVVLFWAIVGALLGWYVANQKGRSASEGVILGFLLGLVGVVIEALLPTRTERVAAVSGPTTRYPSVPQRPSWPTCGYRACQQPATYGLHVDGNRLPERYGCDAHIDAVHEQALQYHPNWHVLVQPLP